MEIKVAQGRALHIGLNSVDAGHYQGWSGPLRGCEADAQDMENIALNCGFNTKKLLTKAATRASVISEFESAAAQLNNGDIFFVSISCHGGQVPDTDGDESDGEDETWCLYDGQFIDDEVYYYLSKFKVGARIVSIPRQSRGLYDLGRSKRLEGSLTRSRVMGPPAGGCQRQRFSCSKR